MITNKTRNIAIAIVTLLIITGCAITPEPMMPAEREAMATATMENLFGSQEPITAPISLAEAIARSLKYNLDARVELMAQAVENQRLNTARLDLLPRITADAGYVSRDNQSGASSESLLTHTQSLEPSTSQEKSRGIANASMVWNILDFGVSYLQAKQDADRTLIASERRRKVIQNIIQDVRYAFWRAWSAQQLLADMEALIADSQAALKQSRAVEQDAAQTPKTALEYQRTLLNTQRTFWDLRQKLMLAKTELATLMSLKPGTSFSLSSPNGKMPRIPELDISLDELERQALMHRPELMEQDYQLRISQKEVKKALLRMLPGLELQLGAHYDNNNFLYNNHWADAGLSLSWNLLNLIRGPSVQAAAEAEVELQKARSLAKGMAVLTQVHLAYQRLQIAKDSFTIAEQLNDVNQRLLKQAQAGTSSQTGSELNLIRARASTLVTHMRRDLAYAELQNAHGRINHTIGKDPLPKSVAAHDLTTLTEAIAAQLESN